MLIIFISERVATGHDFVTEIVKVTMSMLKKRRREEINLLIERQNPSL